MTMKKKMDDLDLVVEKYAGTPLGEMVSDKQAEYLSAIAKRAASDALAAVGLNDSKAAEDIRDIRDLLRGLRVMKKIAWSFLLSIVGRFLGWVLVLALVASVLSSDAVETALHFFFKS
ncbi:MAG: hypothetical protein PHS57_06870 [Alphaproteobacteria bacterium]|nr:hypothetical protein [Alphaproteobacteria bacterium]